MTRYKIFLNGSGLACQKKEDSTISYIAKEREFRAIVDDIIESGYKVKIKGGDVILCGRSMTIVIKDYDKVESEPMMHNLSRDIDATVKKKGFIDITNADKLNKKPNRNKSRSRSKALIVKVSALLLAAGLVAGLRLNNSEESKLDEISSKMETFTVASSERKGESSFDEEKDFDALELSHRMESLVESLAPIEPNIDFAQEKDVDSMELEFENLSITDKAIYAKENYNDLMIENARAFGLDENLLLGIATQERGVHSSKIDTLGGIGLMQIQYDVWVNKTITYYKLNEETGLYEKGSLKITDEMLRNLKTNVEIAAMILQDCLIRAHYNIPIAIQMYNQGCGAIQDIIILYCNDTGKNYEDVLNDPEDKGWMAYRYLKVGDEIYIENINKWLDENVFKVINVLENSEVEFEFNRVGTASF